jgi:hypothetical protein
MTVFYEWDVEEIDEHDDIQRHNHTTSYAKAKAIAAAPCDEPGMTCRIVLVRDDDNTRTGYRSWAYLQDDGKLPEYFEDAQGVERTKVPKHFHAEVDKT